MTQFEHFLTLQSTLTKHDNASKKTTNFEVSNGMTCRGFASQKWPNHICRKKFDFFVEHAMFRRYWAILRELFPQHRHFTRQIAFSTNIVVPILPDCWQPNFLCFPVLLWTQTRTHVEALKKLNRKSVSFISRVQIFLAQIFPLKTAIYPCKKFQVVPILLLTSSHEISLPSSVWSAWGHCRYYDFCTAWCAKMCPSTVLRLGTNSKGRCRPSINLVSST